MKKIVLLIIISLVIQSCEKEIDQTDNDDIHFYFLRIKNDTPFIFENVYAEHGASQHNFGSLQPDEISEYKNFELNKSGDYPLFKISTRDQDFELGIQPIDPPPNEVVTTHEKLPPLTCVITVNQFNNNNLGLYFIE